MVRPFGSNSSRFPRKPYGSKTHSTTITSSLEQVNKDAEVFKDLWQGFLSDVPLPPDSEIKVAVRRLALEDLADGIESYAAQISRAEGEEAKHPRNRKECHELCLRDGMENT